MKVLTNLYEFLEESPLKYENVSAPPSQFSPSKHDSQYSSLNSEQFFPQDEIKINSQLYEGRYHNKYRMEGRCCFKYRPHWNDMPDRQIISNIPDHELCDNKICTSKYTMWNFVPLNLFEQFSKMANLYFLIIGYFETVKAISITEGQPIIWFPLFLVICISGLKDFFEDFKRHKSDEEENNILVLILCQNGFQKKKWQEIKVGDIIKVENNQFFPADICLLGSSQKGGQCFVETKNLDGETNLKVKKTPRKVLYLSTLLQEDLYNQNLWMIYEKPNPYLYKFVGSLNGEFQTYQGSQVSSSPLNSDSGIPNNNVCALDAVNFVLRGCSLQNTEWVFGVVAYSGHDTKVLLNSTQARLKRSHLENVMNFFIILVFFIQIVVCLFSAQYNSLWQEQVVNDVDYLELDENSTENQFFFNLFVSWGTWLLIFTNFVPISLLVTLEMVKFLQGIIIHNDKLCLSGQIRTVVQSSSLNEELGQVDVVFSDKTGTLTKNIMEFKMMSINGRLYGQSQKMTVEQININKLMEQSMMPKVENVDFNDINFFQDLENQGQNQDALINFMIHLSICHTIIVVNKDGQLIYNASSPDELALTNGAKYCGFEFIGTDDQGMLVMRRKQTHMRFQLLNVLEFTSSRKRMSIIVKLGDGTIKLLCKGADTVLEKLLSQESHQSLVKKRTWGHLEQMAQKGLRTLLLAERTIQQDEYTQWCKVYQDSYLAVADRDLEVEVAQAKIEVKLELLGATGIEDKLQDEVSETMVSLIEAGLKIWILTGDKIETAINICYSCGILTDQQSKIIIDGETQVHVSLGLSQGLTLLKNNYGLQCSLIVSGDALIHLLKPINSEKMMQIAKKCQSVICCRVSPKQKQEVVTMVMHHLPEATTLAIGDGANDVNMITAAHIGVGIKGVEGNQAARAADYAIGEFKIIRPLLLVHGRECFRRNTTLVGYNFYKNLVVVLPHFWFSFNNGFSASNLYNPWMYQLYNLLYTSLPIVLYAILDAEYSPQFLMRNPRLYQIRDSLFLINFFNWFLLGVIQSAVITYACFPSFESSSLDSSGQMQFLASVGMAVFCYSIIVVNLQIIVFSNTYTLANVLINVLSILILFISYMTLSLVTMQLDISKSFFILVTTWHFWGVMAVILTLTDLIDLGRLRWINFTYQRIIENKQRKGGFFFKPHTSPDYSLSSISHHQIKLQHSDESSQPLNNQYPNVMFEDDRDEEEKEDDNYSLEEQAPLFPRPQLRRKYTGYGFSQQEKVLDSALKNAEN